MAFLRSCYSTKARFFYDSSRQDTIKWYWAEEGATRFTGRSSFAPLSFSQPSIPSDNDVGEVPGASRPWRDGSRATTIPSGVLDGEKTWFFFGQSAVDPGLSRTAFGIPSTCAEDLSPYNGCSFKRFDWMIWFGKLSGPFGPSTEVDGRPFWSFDIGGGLVDAWLGACGITPIGPVDTGFIQVDSVLGVTYYFYLGWDPKLNRFAYGAAPGDPIDSASIYIWYP